MFKNQGAKYFSSTGNQIIAITDLNSIRAKLTNEFVGITFCIVLFQLLVSMDHPNLRSMQDYNTKPVFNIA